MQSSLWALLMIWLSTPGSLLIHPGYYDYTTFSKFLLQTIQEHSNITHLYSIGKSAQGRDLWVLALAADSPSNHMTLRPELKYIANMHGNEILGPHLLVYLIDHLVTQYGTDTRVTSLLQSARIHIMLSMNPDGLEKAMQAGQKDCHTLIGRNNAYGYDLNRNFPDIYRGIVKLIQPETEGIIRWLQRIPFILSAQLHSGSMVASYPYDSHKAGDIPMYAKSADDDVFRSLALSYSQRHPGMMVGYACPGENSFTQGITNGAQWYPSSGGMQDYNYIFGGCFEITLELSCCHYPSASELPHFWEDNKDSLLAFMENVNGPGIRGLVTDADSQPVFGAWVIVEARGFPAYRTTPAGEFWRLLRPGRHQLLISADGYLDRRITVNVAANKPTVIHIKLKEKPPILLPRKSNYNPAKEDKIITVKTLAVVLILIVYSSMYIRGHALTGDAMNKLNRRTALNMKPKLTFLTSFHSNSKVLACIIMALLVSGAYIKHHHELSTHKESV